MGEQRADVFSICGHMRVYLVFQLLVPLFFIGLILWAVSSSKHAVQSDREPLILLGLGLWAAWELISLVRWIGFSVAISDAGVAARGRAWPWDRVASVRARDAVKFGTFVEIQGTDGSSLSIPAAIENNAFVLTLIEKHAPDLERRR